MEKREKIVSYFDWELQFRSINKEKIKLEKQESKDSIKNLLNSLGLEKEKFKKFLEVWKKQNL